MKRKNIFKIAFIAALILTVAVGCFVIGAMASEDSNLAGDVNLDGFVNVKDLLVMRQYFANFDYSSGEEKSLKNGDFNKDGSFDIGDLAALRQAFSNDEIYEYQVNELGLLDLKHTLRVNEDGSFKVLILSDVQCYNAAGIKNSGTLDIIEAMVEKENPDLVLFLGDNSWSCNTKDKLREYLSVMVAPIEARKIPWAHIYGNHDSENNEPHYTAISKEDQQEVYEEFEYCVSKSGPEELSGVGNYVLPVLSYDGSKIAFNVWALDSLMYNYPRPNKSEIINKGTSIQNSFPYDYEGLKEDQVKWYEETSKLLEKYNGGESIPAMMYFHIPLQESYYAWADAVTGGKNGATNLVGHKAENISAPAYNSGLFDAIVKRGDVKVVANGHDHVNDFAVDYKGVTLAYCGSTGVQEYHDYDIVGGRVVNFNADGSVTTAMSYIKDIPEYDNSNPIINMEITENGVTNAANDRYELSHKGDTTKNSIVYDKELGRYVVTFNGTQNNPGVYNYPAADITPIMYDGFSYEIVFKVDDLNFSSGYVGILDMEEEGGFGLNVYKVSGDSTKYLLKAEVSKGPYKTSGWQSDEMTLEVGKWYHVVYSYNWVAKDKRSTALYVNGVKVAGVDLSGINSGLYREPNFATKPGVEDFICIGGCAQHKTTGINGFTGAIALCNLMPTPMASDEAIELYNTFFGIEEEKTPILDLEISENGVVNGAENRPSLNDYTQNGTKKVVYNEELGKYVVDFVGDTNKPSTYTLPSSDFNSTFKDGFSYEIMFKIDKTDFTTTYVGILDYEENGGFGLDVYKSSTAGKYTLYAEVSAGVSSGWNQDKIELNLGEWYHLVYVYTGSSTSVYINGVKVGGSDNITAPYRVPSFTGGVVPYICIGACAQSVTSGAGVNGMTGSIALAKIMVDPIGAEEALALYNAAIAK